MNEAEPTTRENILIAARKEFSAKGYGKAGLREIAKEAGVTTGALYGYFSNKHELFEALVGESYHGIMDMYCSILHSFHEFAPEDQAVNMKQYTEEGMKRMTDYMYAHYDAFKLILCCSEGTEYNQLIHEMARLDVEATHDFVKTEEALGTPMQAVNPTLEHMLTYGMFSSFFELIIHDVPKEEVPEYLRQLLDFYAGGWQTIMGF